MASNTAQNLDQAFNMLMQYAMNQQNINAQKEQYQQRQLDSQLEYDRRQEQQERSAILNSISEIALNSGNSVLIKNLSEKINEMDLGENRLLNEQRGLVSELVSTHYNDVVNYENASNDLIDISKKISKNISNKNIDYGSPGLSSLLEELNGIEINKVNYGKKQLQEQLNSLTSTIKDYTDFKDSFRNTLKRAGIEQQVLSDNVFQLDEMNELMSVIDEDAIEGKLMDTFSMLQSGQFEDALKNIRGINERKWNTGKSSGAGSSTGNEKYDTMLKPLTDISGDLKSTLPMIKNKDIREIIKTIPSEEISPSSILNGNYQGGLASRLYAIMKEGDEKVKGDFQKVYNTKNYKQIADYLLSQDGIERLDIDREDKVAVKQIAEQLRRAAAATTIIKADMLATQHGITDATPAEIIDYYNSYYDNENNTVPFKPKSTYDKKSDSENTPSFLDKLGTVMLKQPVGTEVIPSMKYQPKEYVEPEYIKKINTVLDNIFEEILKPTPSLLSPSDSTIEDKYNKYRRY